MRAALVAGLVLLLTGCASGFVHESPRAAAASERSDPMPQAGGGGGM